MVAGPGTTACLLDASGRGSTHLPSKKTNTRVGKKKNRRREDGKAAMDPPTSCPLGRVDVKFNCDIVKLLRSTVNVAIWCVRSCLVDCEVVYAPLLSTCVRIYRHKRRRYLYMSPRRRFFRNLRARYVRSC